MDRNRLEAFSDGVIAIIITIMVLELKVPHEPTLAALRELWPVFLSYLLSFIFVGIYWNNHHHLFQAVRRVSGRILWMNLHLLFWLSLVPFVTGWMGENHFAPVPVFAYGVVLLGAAVAYYLLTLVLLGKPQNEPTLARALRSDVKEKVSIGLYVVAIASALFLPWLACAAYVTVAIIWLVPDPRIEKTIERAEDSAP